MKKHSKVEPEEVDTSAALVPEPPEAAGPQTYVVTAPTAVHGHEPGTEFTMLIPQEQEALLLESGALKKARTPTEKEQQENG